MNSSKEKAVVGRESGQIEHPPVIPLHALQWARQWREGNAQCPGCSAIDFELVDAASDGQMRYETFRCKAGECGTCWKVEFREAALVILGGKVGGEDDWIDLLDERSSTAFTARETATVLAALRCWRRKIRWRYTRERRNEADFHREQLLTSEEIDALCRRIAQTESDEP